MNVIIEPKGNTGPKRHCSDNEYLVKNAELVRARKSIGYGDIKKFASAVGINYQNYRLYENLLVFPNFDARKKIGDFYRSHNIDFNESAAFSTELKDLSRLVYQDNPIEEEIYDESLLLGVSCGYIPNPEEDYIREDFSRFIDMALNTLEPRKSEIIRLYFGFTEEGVMTFEQIGDRFRLTKARIQQLYQRALRELRLPSRSETLKEFL